MKYFIDLVVSQYDDEDAAFEGGNPTTFQERNTIDGDYDAALAEFEECYAEVLYEGDDIIRNDYVLKDEDGNVLETTEGSSIE